MVVILQTHPIQYQAPIYRYLQQELNIPVTAVYGSDFSIAGYHDAEFNTSFAWDSDLLSGYSHRFLTTVATGGPSDPAALTGEGIAAALDEIQPTAVLLTGYGFPFHRAAFRYARGKGYPLLLRGETTDADQQRTAVKKMVRDIILRWYYAQFDGLLPIGSHSTAHYDRLAPTNTPRFFSSYCIDTVPFAASEDDRTRLRAATRHQLGLPEHHRVILFSGKLIDKKAPELLLESVKRLPTKTREQIAVIYLGDGNLRSSLENQAKAEPSVNVHFLGFQNQTALSPYYHAADLMVLPSRYRETWGLVVNEALHHGLPCIVSDRVGSAPDLIISGQTGEVFAHNDAAALTTALQRVMGWLGTTAVRDRCRAQVANYTIEKAAVGIAEAYHYTQQS